jgi:hypothetical protein
MLKMATSRNCSMSGHHYLPTCQILMISDNVSDFNANGYVGRLWCPELIPDIEKFLPVAIFKNGHHNTAQIQRRNCSMTGINSGHHYLPTYQILIISDNVEFLQYSYNLTSDRSPLEEQFCSFQIFEMSAIFKMAAKTRHEIWAVKIQHFPISSKFDIWVENDIYPHMKCRWNRTMLNLCGIVVAILKMAIGRNCSM